MDSHNPTPAIATQSSPTLAATVAVAAFLISIWSFAQITIKDDALAADTPLAPVQFVQATPPIPAGKDNGPAQSDPGGGARPTTPAPEPAQPDADAQKAGAQPALPAAPAEKVGEPIKK